MFVRQYDLNNDLVSSTFRQDRSVLKITLILKRRVLIIGVHPQQPVKETSAIFIFCLALPSLPLIILPSSWKSMGPGRCHSRRRFWSTCACTCAVIVLISAKSDTRRFLSVSETGETVHYAKEIPIFFIYWNSYVATCVIVLFDGRPVLSRISVLFKIVDQNFANVA